MTDKCRIAFQKCREISEELELPALKNIAEDYEGLVDHDTDNIVFVDLSGFSKGLYAVASAVWESEILEQIFKQLGTVSNWRIQITYGDEEAVYAGAVMPEYRIGIELLKEQVLDDLVLTLPEESLRGKTVILLNAGDNTMARGRRMASAERIFMLTNADMAMTQYQKEWIAGYISEHYDFDRFGICVFGLENVMNEKQESEVFQYIREYLNDLSGLPDIRIVPADKESLRALIKENIKILREPSEARVTKNMLEESVRLLAYEAEGCVVQKETYEDVERQVSAYQEQLIRAASVTLENILDNQINAVIDAISKSAEEYGNSMYESIRDAVQSAKDIEEVENRINPYMERCWKYFAEQTSLQVSADFDTIHSKLTERMERDIEDMVKKLNLPARAVLERFVDGGDLASVPQVSYDFASDADVKSVARKARNIMILSVPLLFVSPQLSVSALLGGGIYSKLGGKKEEVKYRYEVLNHVEAACRNARRSAVDGFASTLESEKKRMKELVAEGYKNLIRTIQEEMERRKMEWEQSAKRGDMIRRRMDELLETRNSL